MSDVQAKPDIAAHDVVELDYELDATVNASTASQLKALFHPTRTSILDLVLERAATTTELAEALDKPKGTVDHHLKVLERAGLVKVVRTRQVRAMTERFWGRTARTIIFAASPDGDQDGAVHFLRVATAEVQRMQVDRTGPGEENEAACRAGEFGTSTLRHARIAPDRVAEFSRRLDALAVEFSESPRGGDTVFGLVLALYPTDQPTLPLTATPNATENAPENAPQNETENAP